MRTSVGELDVIAEKDGVLAFVEVKVRRTLADAAFALQERQRRRIVAAAGVWLADHPGAGPMGVRFDVIVVDAAMSIRRIADAFRAD